MKIVHIIPTFNEKDNIGQMITVINKISRKYPRWKSEILIVDDRSPDGTSEIVRKYQKIYKNVHLILKKKEGLGKALILGYDRAINKFKADIIIPNDADFQYDPKDYPKLMKKIEEGFDVVVASRHIPGGKIIGWNWFRNLNHAISNYFFAWWLAGVREVKDHAGNFKALRVKDLLEKIPLRKMRNAGFSFQLHILYELSKTGAKFTEIPVIFRERKFGKSKIGFNRYYLRDVMEYIKSSFLIRFDRSASFFKYCIVGASGFIIQTIISQIMIVASINPGLSVSIGAEGAIISNFVMNNSWTFHKRKIIGIKIIRKFIQFNTASIGSIIIQGIIVALGTAIFGPSSWFLFMVLAIVFVVVPYSYFIYNRYIWKK